MAGACGKFRVSQNLVAVMSHPITKTLPYATFAFRMGLEHHHNFNVTDLDTTAADFYFLKTDKKAFFAAARAF